MNRDKALEELDRIRKLAKRIDRLDHAEAALDDLINSLDPVTLRNLQPIIEDTIHQIFLPARRKRLQSRLRELSTGDATRTDKSLSWFEERDRQALATHLRGDLRDLAEHHIFQWSTFYRDTLAYHFDSLLTKHASIANPEVLSAVVKSELSTHASDVYTKGYQYTTTNGGSSHSVAVVKSLAGLQRFLDIAIDLYATHASRVRAGKRAVAVRQITSAVLAGILQGYARCIFGRDSGAALLPVHARSWAHYLGFLAAPDLLDLANALEPGPMRLGIEDTALPLTQALDRVARQSEEEGFALPGLGEFLSDHRRLDVSLLPPAWLDTHGFIRITCYLDSAFVTRSALETDLDRDVTVVVAAVESAVYHWVRSHDRLRTAVVNTLGEESTQGPVADRITRLLSFAAVEQKGETIRVAAVTYNFARDFPLHNPFLTKYFHVYRASIRSLLRSFERRNGARLWCSVRRSGKTTACFDLGSSTGGSAIVSQTCDFTDQYPGADLFYQRFVSALEDGSQLPRSFFQDAVQEAASSSVDADARFVFVLDEYETLFERMALAVHRDPELRYTVAQPLLSQMVGFVKDHLIVFIGQRPDAHYILMDQNQLSPYVEQDGFPLFSFDPLDDRSEFHELLRKVLTERVVFDGSFAAAVYNETAGHPFLTVNLLVVFFDWLIDKEWEVRNLHFEAENFAEFREERLNDAALGIEKEYNFFKHAIAEALSEYGRSQTPWLHAVYRMLRVIALESPESMTVTRREFGQIARREGVTDALGFTSDYLLSGGSLANFFRLSSETVQPKVPLLARLARVSRETVHQ